MRLLSRFIFFILFILILVTIIAFARGYRIDLQNKSLTSTGILAISSYPNAAKIYIDNQLKGVTDANLTLPPGNYNIDIKKDGYTSWSRKINLKGELVVTVEPILFPVSPSLSPLTNLGIIKAVPVEEGERNIIFTQDGIYLFETSHPTLPFFPPLKTIIKKSLFPDTIDFSNAKVTISPDFKQGIFEFGDVSYLLSLEEENLNPLNVTMSKEVLISAWEKQKQKDIEKILETFPEDFSKIATASFQIISFSPNETKVLYQALENVNLGPIITPPLVVANQSEEERSLKKGRIYIYDKKEDKNFKISNFQFPASKTASSFESLSSNLKWYFDSRHLVIEENKKISIIEYDNTNKQAVYSGPFEADFFTTTNDGKIIALINLNPEVNELPDLYLIGIR
jgi:hypothetical protein